MVELKGCIVQILKNSVIHRGFSTYSKTKFRNNPEWQIPIELQNKFPDLPLICDPSHICGRREILLRKHRKKHWTSTLMD